MSYNMENLENRAYNYGKKIGLKSFKSKKGNFFKKSKFKAGAAGNKSGAAEKATKIKTYAPVFAALLTCVILSVFPSRYAGAAADGLKLWALVVLPSLLPFFFLTLLITASGALAPLAKRLTPLTRFLYNAGGACGFIQLMSFISGYPVGARLISELYSLNALDEKTAAKASAFCSTSGPAFVIGSVGAGMLSSPKAGAVIFACHILSAVFTGVIYRKYCDYQPIAPLFKNGGMKNPLAECAYSTSVSCLTVGTLICFFYVISTVASDFYLLYPLEFLLTLLFKNPNAAKGFCSGLLECTKGALELSRCELGFFKLPLITFIITFGGISVIAQSLAFLKQAGVKSKFFITAKLIQAVISFALCAVFQLIFAL